MLQLAGLYFVLSADPVASWGSNPKAGQPTSEFRLLSVTYISFIKSTAEALDAGENFLLLCYYEGQT